MNDRERILTREILTLASVVILGSIMTILDATIVNVALATLGQRFHTSIATIQWVATIYLLAFASVIPMTAWASERFGARRVWIGSLLVFMLGSLLSGLAWSIGALIAFRALQGFGGGMILPLGQTILAEAAGRERLGRVMSFVGVPMLLAPIFGPAIGGALIAGASWRWIFFVNLPVGAVAVALALRFLPSVPQRRGERLDGRGLALLGTGIALFVYGLSRVGSSGAFGDAVTLATVGIGLLLIASFAWHALRRENALLDLRLFARRGYATAVGTNFLLGVALFGVLVLLPLYFQTIRGASPLRTGLLMVPQGVGAALAMPIAGALTDRLGARRVVPAGIVVGLLGTAAYTQISAGTSYWYLALALFVIGLGLGATIMPSMAVAYQAVPGRAVAAATSTMNTLLRIAGSLGVALMAVILQRAIAAKLPGFQGALTEAAALAANRPEARAAIASAFAATFWVALGLAAVALFPACLLPRPSRARTSGPAPA
ncbi:MAG: DHA2 family efflux MFS transporter permease subunit [Actinomycetota bacterium]|nr:DHA2 family efflux MFS transporter permease subunit [Actinomycetota bacterium]